ncbi:anti-sigma factor [Variovorax sp. VNK109]|uniref:anti-sigma factor n=1 Tax=Variovorax sp. VNK109 TaxID=3400919 RepID=UPI003C108F76
MNTPVHPSPGNIDPEVDRVAGEYVLGTLSAHARQAVEARLPHEPALRAAVATWEERLLPLTSIAEPVEPGVGLWQRIEKSVAALMPAGAAKAGTAGTWRDWWSSLNFWRYAAVGGYALAAVLAAVGLQRTAPVSGTQYLVVLVAPQDKTPGWVVQAGAGNEPLSLVPLGTTPVPPDKSLQFWTKGEQWSGPMSLGLVAPGQTFKVPLDRLPPLENNQLFELTLEPAQGSPLNRPTGPILFIGRAVKVQS